MEKLIAKENLREFFRAKTKKMASHGSINWLEKKNDWISAINKLYEKITKHYLAGIKTVTYSRKPKEIVEDYVGTYQVEELILQVGYEKVVFSPKGMNIVGATGRIDLRGDMGDVTIVREPGDRWGIVATRIPILKIVPLNEESLLNALKSVMRK